MNCCINEPFSNQHFHDIIECLVAALEARDNYTSGHSTRVADMACDLARILGIENSQLEHIHIAAHLHDIGKIGIPDSVLNKNGRLLPAEWDQVRLHPEIGYRILCKSKGLQIIAEIVLHHHERWDGKGYPDGISREGIPLGSRIIAVADSVDAMTSHRPYRQALSWQKCQEEILAQKARQFDPALVEAAEILWPQWEQYYSRKQHL